jgi:excisionase family DNA binding protein
MTRQISAGHHKERQVLSIPDACATVGVSRRTMHNWIASGKVQHIRTAGGRIRIYADSLWRTGTNSDAAQTAELPDQPPCEPAR